MEEELKEEGHSRHEKNHFDNASQWYPKVSEYTFATKFISLSKIQCEVISKTRQNGRMIGSMYNFTEDKEERKKILQMDPVQMLQEDERIVLKELEEAIDHHLQDYKNGAFVRLDTRSPKDAVLNSKLVKEIITEKIKQNPIKDKFSMECATSDSIIYWDSVSEACRVTSGAQAVELLTSSNRVSEDITLGLLSHGEGIKIVIREWENIQPHLEFRVFIRNREITGITQYHKGLYIKKVVDNLELVEELITEAFNKIKNIDISPDHCYTADFVLITDGNTFTSARLIEINDPPPTAGTSLFDWDDENDRNLILNGPKSIRVYKEPISWEDQQKQSTLHPPLLKLIDQLRGRIPAEKESNNCVIC